MDNQVKELREKKGLTLRKLSIALDCTEGTISNIELGKTRPNIELVRRIADYFGVTIDYLFPPARGGV